jgi:hypothetical protein
VLSNCAKLKIFSLFFILAIATQGSMALAIFSSAKPNINHLLCSEALDSPRGGLISERSAFLLQVVRHFIKNGTVPSKKNAAMRLRQIGADGIKVGDDWQSIEDFKFEASQIPLLGSQEFLRDLKISQKLRGLKDDQVNLLELLNKATDESREELKATLIAEENKSLKDTGRLLNLSELENLIKTNVRDSKYKLSDLGYPSVKEWRADLLSKQIRVKQSLRRILMDHFKNIASNGREIPEDENDIYRLLAEANQSSLDDIRDLIESLKVFKNVNALIDAAIQKYPIVFSGVLDRRFFTQAKTDLMLQAIRNSSEIILIKLAENQDVPREDFEAIEKLSLANNNAPIIVAPPFGDISLVPKKLSWLLESPNVHVMVDMGVRVLQDFVILNNGALDKQENPFVGLERVFQPTDRVVLFSPKVRTTTRATGSYDTNPSYFTTTGAINIPAYGGKFTSQIPTDVRAQLEAEQNRGVLLLSRRYADQKLSSVIGGAQAIVPRRISYTEPLFGNPAGFFDLNQIFTSKGAVKIKKLAAIVLGDLHIGITDPLYLKALFKMFVELGILEKRIPAEIKVGDFTYKQGPLELGAIIIHDLVDGLPLNRHIKDKIITQAILDQNGKLDLEAHFQKAADFLVRMNKLLPNTTIFVPVDNHGSDWLENMLQDGYFPGKTRPGDLKLVLRLTSDAIDGARIYERIFQYMGVDTDRVRFLGPQETASVGIDLEHPNKFSITNGVQGGIHSQMGIKGAKSISIQKLLSAYGPNVTGHTHSTGEYGQSKKAGTATGSQSYQRGPSDTVASLVLVYGQTTMQTLNLARGTFLPNAGDQKPEHFFPSKEYPILMKFSRPQAGHTTDAQRAHPPVPNHRRH